LIGGIAAQNLYSALTTTPLSRILTNVGNHPHWSFVAALVALDVFFAGVVIDLALTPMRKNEKVMWLALAAGQLVIPEFFLFPKIIRLVGLVYNGFLLIAFFAAVALFMSFSDEQERKEP